MITQYIDQSAAVMQSVTGQAGAVVHRVQHSDRCSHVLGLTDAHCFEGGIPCNVCCFWVSDPNHNDRGPHEPVSVYFNGPWQCFPEPFWGCPYFVFYPDHPTRGQSITGSVVAFFIFLTLKAQNTVDRGTKFRVIGDDTEVMQTFDSKLWNLLHFCLLLLWFTKFLL